MSAANPLLNGHIFAYRVGFVLLVPMLAWSVAARHTQHVPSARWRTCS